MKASTLIGLLGAGALVFLGYKSSATNNQNAQNDDFNPITNNLTFDLEWYVLQAKRIIQAYKQMFSLAENRVVKNTISLLKNTDDWKQLYNNVGTFKDGWKDIDLIYIIEGLNKKDRNYVIRKLQAIGVEYSNTYKAKLKEIREQRNRQDPNTIH